MEKDVAMEIREDCQDMINEKYGEGDTEYRLNAGNLINGLHDFLGTMISISELMDELNEIELDIPSKMADEFKAAFLESWGEGDIQRFLKALDENYALTPEEIFGVVKVGE